MASLTANGITTIFPAPLVTTTPTVVHVPIPAFPIARSAPVQIDLLLIDNIVALRSWIGIPPFPRTSPSIQFAFTLPIHQFDLTKVYTPLKGGSRFAAGHQVIYPDPQAHANAGTVPPKDGWSGITI